MRLEFIDKVKENQVLGKNILSNDGKILLSAGLKLNDKYIQKLKGLGVFCVYVEDEMLDDIKFLDSRFTELKQITMKNMSHIVKNIYNNGEKNVKELMGVVEDLINCIIDMGEVSKSLYEIQSFDNYTYFHSIDTCIMSSFLGITAGIGDGDLVELGVAAMLHDVGKTMIPKNVVCKEGALSEEEYQEMKNHTVYGAEILKKSGFISETVIESVLHHHERIDGNGYPFGLVDKEISQFAKIVCICDVYDAVSCDRSYRKKITPEDAYKTIVNGSGSYFDPKLVRNFQNTFAVYPLGSCIKLSNDIEGYVIKQSPNLPDRPIIRVLYDSFTKRPIPFYEINLMDKMDIFIKSLVL